MGEGLGAQAPAGSVAAEEIAYLADDAASFIHGAVLPLDGGRKGTGGGGLGGWLAAQRPEAQRQRGSAQRLAEAGRDSWRRSGGGDTAGDGLRARAAAR